MFYMLLPYCKYGVKSASRQGFGAAVHEICPPVYETVLILDEIHTKTLRLGIAKINFVSALGLQFILYFVYNNRYASA